MKNRPVWLGVVLLMSAPARADTVCDWMEAADAATDLRPADGRTAEQSGVRARVALAMFEALNAIDRQYVSYLGLPPATQRASPEASAATAAYEVLQARAPALRGQLETTYRTTMAAVVDDEAREAGRLIGKAAAQAALERPVSDSKVVQRPYRPRTAPGVWVPTDLPYYQPFDLAQKPWAIAHASAVRPGSPPLLTSARWTRDYDEVKRLGAKRSATRTLEQTVQAHFWVQPDLGTTLRRLAESPGRSLLRNARLFAQVYMALDDAALAAADAKLHFNFWRPLTAIRNGEFDANPATSADPAWEPLLNTPMHPEFPCAHCLNASALAAVLSAEFGAKPVGGVRFTKRQMPGVVMTLPTFAEYVTATSFSRILAGVHYRFSNEAGEAMGRKIGDMVVRTAFAPSPVTRAAAVRSP